MARLYFKQHLAITEAEHSPYTGNPHSSKTKRFKSLADLQSYAKTLFFDVDYIDGQEGWHSDYMSYRLIGCSMADLGKRLPDGYGYFEWIWTDLSTELHNETN